SRIAASFGVVGQPGHPDVQAAIRDAADRLKAAGKPAGILTVNPDEARRYIDWGFTFVAVGIDLLLLARGADALRADFGGRDG
ncbi:MAG: 2-dehydro-3-deoxyglucarate aldolase, partial [Rhodospirillaceae bacterium]|nr:2-dehydro-3-deoxyglucarate aldolase [Rhodospirillaceae bacterium]